MSSLLLASPKEAITSLERLLDIKPDKNDTSYNEGNKLFKLERYEDALISYAKPLETQPDLYEAWYNLGNTLFNLRRYEDAIASYDESLKIQPDLYEAWYNRGNTLFILGRYEDAIASYDKALMIRPELHQAWSNRGVALDNLERLDEALSSYDKALAIQPYYYRAWNNRGNVLLGLERYDEAINNCDKALSIKPDFLEAWYNRGFALLDLGRYKEAIASFNQTTQIKLDFPAAWSLRGIALSRLRCQEEAIASFDKALEFKPGLYDVWCYRGIALCELGRLDEALTSYDKALEFKPELHEAWYSKACCYAIQGNVEQAIENLQQAINLNPDEYREMAKTDSAFDNLREYERFQALIQEKSDWEEGETDVEKDIIIQMQPLPQRVAEIDVKHLGIAKLEEGETKIFHDVSWEEFENLLTELGDNRSSRLAYDQGTLEIRMPSQKHEYYKEVIRDLIKYLAEELDLDCESFGSTTWKRKDLLKGAEPDNCFYIQNEPAIRGIKPNIDLSKDPPPDLILEIDYTSPSLNRLLIYASLRVPEIWIYNKNVLRMYHLETGKYKETDTSLAMGSFPIKEIPSFIEKNIKASPREIQKSFRAWVRKYLTESIR